MFHPIGGLTQQERQGKNTKSFEADGTPYLKVPGCKSVAAVRLDSLDIPLSHEVEFPADASLARIVSHRLPLVMLAPGEDGTPVLLRSQLSNDGYWQKGSQVYVTGEWDEESEAEPAKGRTRGN